MLKVGQRAPEFEADASDGRHIKLSELRGKFVVLYFYPAAFTPGCSKETAGFRDSSEDMMSLGAEVIGVSTDDHKTQCDFADSLRAKFPLVGDDDKSICRRYDVLWPLLGKAKRVTYVIDPEGQIAGVFHHEIQVGKHVDDVLRLVQKLKQNHAAS